MKFHLALTLVLGTTIGENQWKALKITSNHNGDNLEEVNRIIAEHPGEDEVMLKKRVLGAIAVTRGIF